MKHQRQYFTSNRFQL